METVLLLLHCWMLWAGEQLLYCGSAPPGV
jgi:hypothetical protein